MTGTPVEPNGTPAPIPADPAGVLVTARPSLPDMPDVTKAQIIALVQQAASVALAFGVQLTAAQEVAILGLSGTFSTVLILADAMIRRGRAKLVTAQITQSKT